MRRESSQEEAGDPSPMSADHSTTQGEKKKNAGKQHTEHVSGRQAQPGAAAKNDQTDRLKRGERQDQVDRPTTCKELSHSLKPSAVSKLPNTYPR